MWTAADCCELYVYLVSIICSHQPHVYCSASEKCHKTHEPSQLQASSLDTADTDSNCAQVISNKSYTLHFYQLWCPHNRTASLAINYLYYPSYNWTKCTLHILLLDFWSISGNAFSSSIYSMDHPMIFNDLQSFVFLVMHFTYSQKHNRAA